MDSNRADTDVSAWNGKALKAWLIGPAAAIWLDRGVDRGRGGYFDSLAMMDASNACDFKRLRVTCRQIFVFSQLDDLGVGGARSAMDHGVDFLFSRLRHDDGGFVRSVTLEGHALDDRRDLYDLAFTIFALAAAFERTRDSNLCNEALGVLSFIRDHLDHAAGGYLEGIPATLPRRQNPHMHLLEACLAWLPLSPAPAFREMAQDLLALLARCFWSAADLCLYEYFGQDWQAWPDRARKIFEPGHHFEWIWLLGECEQAGLAVPDLALALAHKAVQHGFSGRGLPYAEVYPDGAVADANCRIWVITEWLRVCATRPAIMQKAGGKSVMEQMAAPLAQLGRFLDAPTLGLWYERCNADTGQFMDEPVPASSLYHIVTGIRPVI